MKNLLLLFIAIISLISTSCRKDFKEVPLEEEITSEEIKKQQESILDKTKDTIGLEIICGKEFIVFDSVNSVVALGIKNKKLWLGVYDTEKIPNAQNKMETRITKENFVWQSQENFCIVRNLGYNDTLKIDLEHMNISNVIMHDSLNFNVLIYCYKHKNKNISDLIFRKGNKETYKRDVEYLSKVYREWYDNSIMTATHRNSVYINDYLIVNTEGEEIINTEDPYKDNYLNPFIFIARNYTEGIYASEFALSNLNILNWEPIWTAPINEDLKTITTNPPQITSKRISVKSEIWKYQYDILYYDGQRETRFFNLNTESGTCEKTD